MDGALSEHARCGINMHKHQVGREQRRESVPGVRVHWFICAVLGPLVSACGCCDSPNASITSARLPPQSTYARGGGAETGLRGAGADWLVLLVAGRSCSTASSCSGAWMRRTSSAVRSPP
jgi:hypothetical protein